MQEESVVLNRVEKMLLHSFLSNKPDGASFSEVEAFLIEKQINFNVKKKIPTMKDILALCNETIVMRGNKLFLLSEYCKYEERLLNQKAENKKDKKPASAKSITQSSIAKNTQDVKVKKKVRFTGDDDVDSSDASSEFSGHRPDDLFVDRCTAEREETTTKKRSTPPGFHQLKLKLIALLSPCGQAGMKMSDVPLLYREKYGEELDYEKYGFNDLTSFLNMFGSDIFDFKRVGTNVNVALLLVNEPSIDLCCGEEVQVNPFGKALSPTPLDENSFAKLYPKNVFGPNDKIPATDIKNWLSVGNIVEVVVTFIYNPLKFYVHLVDFLIQLNALSEELENFYNEEENGYDIFPKHILMPKQICALRYAFNEGPEKWHRAEIIKVTSELKVCVRLIDIGIIVYARYNRLRFLPKTFGHYPRFAFPTALAKVRPVDREMWPESTNKRFLELVDGRVITMQIVDINYEEPVVLVKLFNGKCSVNNTLVREEIAITPHQEKVREAKKKEEEEERRAEMERQAEVERRAEMERQLRAEEEQKRQAEEECRRRAEEKRKRLAEEERQRRAEEERQRRAEEERKRRAEEERQLRAEMERQRREEEERKRRAEEERKRRAEEERQRRAEEERKRRAEEEHQRRAEEERKRQAEEDRKRRAEEERQCRAKEEAIERVFERRRHIEKVRQAERLRKMTVSSENEAAVANEKKVGPERRENNSEENNSQVFPAGYHNKKQLIKEALQRAKQGAARLLVPDAKESMDTDQLHQKPQREIITEEDVERWEPILAPKNKALSREIVRDLDNSEADSDSSLKSENRNENDEETELEEVKEVNVAVAELNFSEPNIPPLPVIPSPPAVPPRPVIPLAQAISPIAVIPPAPAVPHSQNIDPLLLLAETLKAQTELKVQQEKLMEKIQDQGLDEKVKINNVALHLLTNDPDIKEIARYSLETAMSLARKKAEVSFRSEQSNIKPSDVENLNISGSERKDINNLNKNI